MSWKGTLRNILRRTGYDIRRFSPLSHPVARMRTLFETHGITVVLDAGANVGQFGGRVREEIGFSGKLISFEPLSDAFAELQRCAAKDPNWETMNCALGDAPSRATIYVAGNSYSSSLLEMLPSHLEAAPASRTIRTEEIEVKTLDSIFEEICSDRDRVFLKIDTQGYEDRVLGGAEQSLSRIGTLHLEMSLVPLYQGQCLFPDLHDLLTKKGYSLVSLEPEFSDKVSGRMLQLNGTYHRF